MKIFCEDKPIHFACSGCGQCCTGDNDHYITVSPSEEQRIRKYLGISHSWLRRRYMEHHSYTTWGIKIEDGHCVFLDATNNCRIYQVRPTQCRTYPFWPELLRNKRHWNNERKRCEGINTGPAIPLETIYVQLNKQLRAEGKT